MRFSLVLALALAVLAVKGVPIDQEEAELREEFDGMDLDKDGFIDRRELAQMEDAPDEADINEFIMSFDQDGDGKISYQEIIDDALNSADDDEEDAASA
jgi:Ca2+-binding EF-hand superfamily protein